MLAPSMTVIAADSVTFVVGGLLYLVLLITLGVIAIRKGHWVMFIIGLFFPLFWLIGALLPPTASSVVRRCGTSPWCPRRARGCGAAQARAV